MFVLIGMSVVDVLRVPLFVPPLREALSGEAHCGHRVHDGRGHQQGQLQGTHLSRHQGIGKMFIKL